MVQKKVLEEEQKKSVALARNLGAAKAFSAQAKSILKDLSKASADEKFLQAFGKNRAINATIGIMEAVQKNSTNDEITIHSDTLGFNATAGYNNGKAKLKVATEAVNGTISTIVPKIDNKKESLVDAVKDPKWASVKH